MVTFLLVAGMIAAGQGEDSSAGKSPTQAADSVVTVGPMEAVRIAAGEQAAMNVPVRVAEGHRVQANPASSEFLVPLTLEIQNQHGLVFGSPVYPEAEPYFLEGADEALMTYVGDFEVVVPVKAAADATVGDHTVMAELRYQACNSRMCLFPASLQLELQFVVSASESPAS